MTRTAFALVFVSVIFFHAYSSDDSTEGETLCIQRSLIGDQAVIAMGSGHKHARELDKERFEMLVSMMREADEEVLKTSSTKIPYYVFVEHSFPLNLSIIKRQGHKIYPRIAAGMVPLHRQQPFARSVVVNCEVRKKGGAAFDILDIARYSLEKGKLLEEQLPIASLDRLLSTDPIFLQHCEQEYNCRFDSLTFKDVFEEFDALWAQTIVYRNVWQSPRIKKIFDESLAEAFPYIQSLKNAIVDHKETVIGFTRNLILAEKPMKEKIWFSETVRDAFSHFVDLLVIHHLLLLQKQPVEKIIYYVGNSHAWRILRAQLKLGYYQLLPAMAHNAYRDQDNGLGKKMIGKEDFLLLQKSFNEINRRCVRRIQEVTEEEEEYRRRTNQIEKILFR